MPWQAQINVSAKLDIMEQLHMIQLPAAQVVQILARHAHQVPTVLHAKIQIVEYHQALAYANQAIMEVRRAPRPQLVIPVDQGALVVQMYQIVTVAMILMLRFLEEIVLVNLDIMDLQVLV
jgi:hypothetical protein